MNSDRNPAGWFEIYASDMTRARSFYESVFAVELEPLPMPQTEGGEGLEMLMFPGDPSRPGCAGALCRMDGCEPGGNSTIIYFSCLDCAIEEGRVTAAGGTVVKPKFSIAPYGDIALVTDPDGNMIGLHNPPADSDAC